MKIVDAIEDRKLNMVFIIGGNGTHRGIIKIYEVRTRDTLRCLLFVHGGRAYVSDIWACLSGGTPEGAQVRRDWNP